MSLFVDLRQIKSSVTNLSEMVDKISSSVTKEKKQEDRPKRNEILYSSSMYKPTTLGFGVRFSSQEDVYQSLPMPSSRLRSHVSMPNLDKSGNVFEKPSVAHDGRTKIVEIDDGRDDKNKQAIQLSTENLSEWIKASITKRPHFDDDADTHPMDFLEDIKYYISELKMSEEKQLPFIISCLEGMPLMWARCFRNEFTNVQSFYSAFEQEFWGPDKQKAVLYDMKLGKYDDGNPRISMSEYFLLKVSNYRHLTPPPSDLEIVYSLAAHFPTAVELELRLAPKPTLREAYRVLRRREGEAADVLPNYLYEMCEAFQRGQRPESARRDPSQPSSSVNQDKKGTK